MSFETHGFKLDWEDIGHVVLGFLPLDLLWYAREHTTVKLPWPFKGQWPPGKRQFLMSGVPVLFEHRVADSARDEFGRSLGAQLRVIVLISLLIWRW